MNAQELKTLMQNSEIQKAVQFCTRNVRGNDPDVRKEWNRNFNYFASRGYTRANLEKFGKEALTLLEQD